MARVRRSKPAVPIPLWMIAVGGVLAVPTVAGGALGRGASPTQAWGLGIWIAVCVVGLLIAVRYGWVLGNVEDADGTVDERAVHRAVYIWAAIMTTGTVLGLIVLP